MLEVLMHLGGFGIKNASNFFSVQAFPFPGSCSFLVLIKFDSNDQDVSSILAETMCCL